MPIYCNPGNGFDQCWADRWGCPIRVITQLRLNYPLSGDHEFDYRATVAFINDLKAQGYSQIHEYCVKCRT